MKLVKSLLLGAAATVVAAAGAQAADLPSKKAAPVDYVRICSVYGPGFFYIPGTDTCIKIGGRVRFEANYSQPKNLSSASYGTNSQLDIRIDTRTQTDWGLLRTYFDFVARRRTGAWFGSGTAARMGNAEVFGAGAAPAATFPSFTGADVNGNKLESSAYVGSAFIQWGGLTAGRFQSFFDFYADNDNIIGMLDSDVPTDGVAYTYTFGGTGVSATIAAEDGIERRQPIAGATGAFGNGGIFPSAIGPGLANYAITYPIIANPLLTQVIPGTATGVNYGQRQNVPDIVGNVRIDQGWGSAQLSAAWHHISTNGATILTTSANPALLVGSSATTLSTGGISTVSGGFGSKSAEGWAVRGGVKVNLPMLADGDHIYVEAGYAHGSSSYTNSGYPGQESAYGNFGFGSANSIAAYDAIFNPFGQMKLVNNYSALVDVLHYWTPTLRSAVFGSYWRETFGSGIKAAAGYAFGAGCPTCFGTVTLPSGANYNPFSPYYMDGSMWQVGANLIWSPVKNLDIGVEAIYTRSENGHKAFDLNKGYPFVTSGDGQWIGRFRIQRDF